MKIIIEFFLSSEADSRIGSELQIIQNEIEKKIIQLKSKDYGTEVERISIIPIIVDLDGKYSELEFFKERKLFKRKVRVADIRLKIEFNKFIRSSPEEKRLLVIKNIIEAIRVVAEKAKKDFKGVELENDILDILDVSVDEINS